MTMMRSLLVCLVILSCAGLTACGAENPNPPMRYDGGKKDSGYTWPDFGSPKYDYGLKFDTGIKQDGASPYDGAAQDGSSPYDGGGSCPGPSGASCSGCPSTHLCTAAKGGTCAQAVVLSGPASNKAVLKAVAVAYAQCWSKAPSSDTLCSTFDTCNMTGTLTDQMVKTWVCNTAQVSDFPSSALYDDARHVMACSWTQPDYKLDWKISSINNGKKAEVCLSYDAIDWWPDDMDVDLCSNYPPK